jgi:hypothetical protein
VAQVNPRAMHRASRCARWLSAALAALAVVPAARADAGWFAAGDSRLRLDLQLLNDAEIIVLPLNQWPLPRAAVQYALSNAREHFATNKAVAAALERVRARAASPAAGRLAFATGVRGGEPGLWRDFDTLAREDGELAAGMQYDHGRFSVGLEATLVADPEDGDEVRADGSQLTVQWGNWLISANQLDRWWGPGHEGSLILSNNARPMPTFMVERAEARPSGVSWLEWLGPYRFSFGISQMESDRADVDAPLFMAWRVVVMPFDEIELGFSRTAQFCGDDQPCDLDTFGNMLAGNDNPGFDATFEDEPGNQMAGFDLRWNSPIGNLPYALYGQYIGEDESSYLPVKYLSQLGLEVWKPFGDGAMAQAFLEYASTTCSANSGSGPYYNCAYNQGRFNREGYRYKGRSVGYTADRDAENWALGANLSTEDGSLWTATARISRLNRDDFGDVGNTVATVPTDYDAIELGWKGKLLGEPVSIDLGVQSTLPEGGARDTEAFGFISWRHEFRP